jgi:hypothetical protein
VKRRAGHIIGLKLGSEGPEYLVIRLAEVNDFVSVRSQALRLTPNLYNAKRDVERLLKVHERAFLTGAD